MLAHDSSGLLLRPGQSMIEMCWTSSCESSVSKKLVWKEGNLMHLKEM